MRLIAYAIFLLGMPLFTIAWNLRTACNILEEIRDANRDAISDERNG